MGAMITDSPGLPAAFCVMPRSNMVGFKSTATNVTAEDYLDGTKYVRIYGFKNGAWFFIPGPPYAGYLEPGLGYWVAFTQTGTIYP